MPELLVRLRSLIQEGSDRLRQAGIAQPRRESLRIWTELQGTNTGEAVLHSEMGVEAPGVETFRSAIQRRILGEPLPHVTGWCGFRHLALRSDYRALIPRPETEGLVDLLLTRVRTGVVADLGTGGGCIALSLALEGSFSRVVGLDCSSQALALARSNWELVGRPGNVELIQGDLCRPLHPGAFDALISNPPYLTDEEYIALDRSVREWEPEIALRSGVDGMAATTRVLDEGRGVLQTGGWLALEVDASRAQAVARLAKELGWYDVSVHLDLFGRERYLLARRSDTR